MKIKLFGERGFIGSAVAQQIQADVSTNVCNVLINCSGFSKAFEANKNSNEARFVEHSIIDRIKQIKFERLIHVSSICAETCLNTEYGKIKKETEDKLLQQFNNVIILRVGGVVGKGLKKNVVYDILNNKKLFVSSDSVYNYITTNEVGKIIKYLITHPFTGILNVGASESITVKEIVDIIGHETVSYGSKKEIFLMDVKKLHQIYKTKPSSYYIKEFLNVSKT